MKRLSIKSVFGTIAAVVLAFAAIVSPNAIAEERLDRDVQISPPTQRLTLEPGTTYEGSFDVSNIGKDSFEYTLSAVPYSVVDEKYSPDYDIENTYNQIYKWVTFQKDSGKLDSLEKDTVHYTITIPNDVPNGGQYAALTTSVNNGESGMNTTTRVAMLLYVRIPGETRETGNILENNAPGIVFGGNNITVTSLVENTGNVHADATYTFRVYPFGSGEEVYTNEEDPTTKVILPETKRYNSLTWEDTPQLGLYTVEQTIEFMGQTSTTSKLVLVCPIWLIVIFAALIIAIIFTVVMRARARKQTKRESSSSRDRDDE